MRTSVEFRVAEKYAREYLEPSVGRVLGSPLEIEQFGPSVRAVTVFTDDPLYQRIGEIYRRMRKRNQFFFLGWIVRHHYTRKELVEAEFFHLTATVFEPSGEECGTVYDESSACPHCGAGRGRTGPLVLDLRKAPKNKDLARTIAHEWVVSQQLAERLVEAGMSGFELRPVRHKARYADDPIRYEDYPSGQELLRRAERAHVEFGTWEFYVWVNRGAQRDLSDDAFREHAAMRKRETAGLLSSLPAWYELVVTSPPVRMAAQTQCGIGPFDLDEKGEHRCPLGHVRGLNLLSEVYVDRASCDGSDIMRTQEMVGVRRGVLVPSPLILITPRLWQLLQDEKMKGWKADIAYLV
jgi:hypothetical protein